jgi:hypothetical protein
MRKGGRANGRDNTRTKNRMSRRFLKMKYYTAAELWFTIDVDDGIRFIFLTSADGCDNLGFHNVPTDLLVECGVSMYEAMENTFDIVDDDVSDTEIRARLEARGFNYGKAP